MGTRLLILTPCHSVRGGVEGVIKSLHEGLPQLDFDVVVGLARGRRFHWPEVYRRAYPGLRCVEVDGTSGTRTGRLRGLRRVLRDVRPDIVLTSRIFDAYQVVSELKAAGEPLRLAATVFAYEPEYIADLVVYADFVDVCVTHGRLVAKAVQRFTGLPGERVLSIPPGVPPARHRVFRPDHRAPLRLAYAGRLEQVQKRVLDIVGVLAGLARSAVPFHCQIAGGGRAEEELRRQLIDAGLGQHVTFLGWLSTEELYERVYPHTEVFLHFAEWEGVPTAPREAMAHGSVPVMADFLGCADEDVFRPGENVLTFPLGDVEEAARQIGGLYHALARWQRLSDAAAASQTGIYSAEGALAAWATVLNAALERPPAVGRQVPRLPFGSNGRLDHLLGAELAETVRELLRKRSTHRAPGDEWPHCSGLADPENLRQIHSYGMSAEQRAASWPDVT